MMGNSYVKKVNTSTEKKGLTWIDLWTFAYLAIIVMLSYVLPHNSPIAFIVLAVLSAPFYKHIEHYIAILFLVSPIAYFFSTADEAVMSLYTIAVLLLIINSFPKLRIMSAKGLVTRAILLIVVFASFIISSYDPLNGFFELLYIITISIVLSVIADFDINKFVSALSSTACFMFLIYISIFIFLPVTTSSGKMTVSSSVNANTTAFALSQLILIILATYLFSEKKSKKTMIFVFTGMVTLVVVGSRNAVLANVLTIVTLLMIDAKRKGKADSKVFVFGAISMVSIVSVDIVFGDAIFSRYNIYYIFESGGANRLNIWSKIIPYVYENYRWLGYGPSKGITTLTLQSLVNRPYSHSHNTFIEVFCELGIIGLFVFVVLIIITVKNLFYATKKNNNIYIILAVLLGVLYASIGESYFNDIVFWLCVGIANRSDLLGIHYL